MALPAGFLDELRARTPIGAVVGKRVQLSRSGRNWKGCCPFHGEKTPSFYVYDDHYHCFGCGAHGDAVSFIMQSQGLAFMEAVESLASEAGLEVPKPTPAAAEAERRRLDLHDVLDAAATSYRRRLNLPEGARALDYLHTRGLTDETIEKFALGWSGEGRGALAREGISIDMLVEAGLMKASEDDDRPPYDLFFNRVMFPIRDRRGRIISFGGRTLGDGQPKYVNGPETPLFSKRRTLYGLDLARTGVRAEAKLVVVEGYMDVIVLHQAGFTAAVAPLGTSLTEEQLEELWRISPVIHLCFDADDAGARATLRATTLALPRLTSDRSLMIAGLPSREDPDSFIRKRGPAEFAARLDGSLSLFDGLFHLIRLSIGDSTPELRAALSKKLDDLASQIPDKALAWEYKTRLREQFKAKYRPTFHKGPGAKPVRAPPQFRRPTLNADTANLKRLCVIVAFLLRRPDLLPDVEEAFITLDLPPELAALRSAILHWGTHAVALDSASLMTHLHDVGLQVQASQTLSSVSSSLPACASSEATPAEALAGWWHFFGLMNRPRLEEEVELAMQDMARLLDEANQRRLIALKTANNKLDQGEQGENPEPDL